MLENYDRLLALGQEHINQIEQDITLSATREQHIRMTTRLNEAYGIVAEIRAIQSAVAP